MDGRPVRLVFLVVGSEAAAGEHVKAPAGISRVTRHDALRERLIGCRTPDEFHHFLRGAETA